jgi:hypothetical protein
MAAMMQNHRARRKTKPPTALLKPPADVDIVASDSECRIETAYSFKARLAYREVAAW